jgi:hypothetical protein
MEQMYEITTAVPIPMPRKRHNYPYAELQIGESFYVENVKMQSLCNLNRRHGKTMGRKFVCRREGVGVRIWRVE